MTRIKKTKSYAYKFFITTLAFMIAFGCARKESESDNKIVVGYLPIIAHLPAFVAEADGLFDQLDIEFRVFPSSNDLMSALESGQIDISTTVATTPFMAVVAKAISRGEKPPALLFSVSQTGSHTPFDGVFVREDSDIESLSDLRGRRVGGFPGTTAKSIFSFVLERDFNISQESITWIMLPPSAQLDALTNREIDALFAYETTRSFAELGPFRQIHGSIVARALEDAPYGGSAINRQFLESRRPVAEKFIKAFDEGIHLVKHQPSRTRTILQDRLGLPLEVANQCNLEPRLKSSELFDSNALQRFIKFAAMMTEAGEIDSALSWEPTNILYRPK